MSNTRALIDAIISGSAVETEEAFNSAMAEKISTRLDDMRMEVAATMFKSEQVEQVQEEAEQIDEKIYADDYHATSEVSQFGGHRPHVVSKDTGKTMFLGQHSYKTPKHAIEHAQAYLNAYAKGGMHQADNHSAAYATANKHNQHIHEELKGAEQLDETGVVKKTNKTLKNVMAAAKGARLKAQNPHGIPAPEPEHKTAQAYNKALGRAVMAMTREEAEQIDEYNLGSGSKKTSLIGRATTGSSDRSEIPDSVRKQGEEINKIFAKKDEKKKG